MYVVFRLNATNEDILEETLENNNDIIDVITQNSLYMLMYMFLFLTF